MGKLAVCHAALTSTFRRAAIPIQLNAANVDDEERDWAGTQRVLLLALLRNGGRNLKTFWEEVQRSFAPHVTSGELQRFIDELVGKKIGDTYASRGVISAFYLEDECVITFDDFYDAVVCL